jgi:hypothetical protein
MIPPLDNLSLILSSLEGDIRSEEGVGRVEDSEGGDGSLEIELDDATSEDVAFRLEPPRYSVGRILSSPDSSSPRGLLVNLDDISSIQTLVW